MTYICHFNKRSSIQKDENVADEITYKNCERCYRLHCEVLGTEAKYPEGGQAIARYAHACYNCT